MKPDRQTEPKGDMARTRQMILLSRRPALFKAVASWRLPDVEVYLHDSPSEALAQLTAPERN